jgi:hypothetical protein
MFQVIAAIIILLTTAIGWVGIALVAREAWKHTSRLGAQRDLQQPDKSP